MKKTLLILLGVLLIFAGGFFSGRARDDTEAKIEYIQQEPIKGYISNIAPIKIEVPKSPTLPIKRDTVYLDSIRYITEHVDTTEIIRQHSLINHYSEVLFDNEKGKLKVDFSTQYNLASTLSYEFVGMQKQVTRTIERSFSPFITAGYSSNSSFILGFGAYWKHLGLEYNYSRGEQGYYHTVKTNYKFSF